MRQVITLRVVVENATREQIDAYTSALSVQHEDLQDIEGNVIGDLPLIGTGVISIHVEISKLKTGVDGKPFDPAELARMGLENLRQFFEGHEGSCDIAKNRYLALAAIADRLQTCDALEVKIRRTEIGEAGSDGRSEVKFESRPK